MPQTILIVDDELPIRRFLRISLTASGFTVIEAENGRQGIAQAASAAPDLVVLDLGLPDIDGQEVVTAIRQSSVVPVIVLSVRADETDKIEALDRGATDYVTKPFGTGELLARIRAALRRPSPEQPPTTVQAGDVVIDLERRLVTRAGEELKLSRKELELLEFFAKSPDHVLTHQQILRAVWGPAHVEDTAYLRVYVNQLRQKLEPEPAQPRLLVTEAGVGYRLKAE